MPQLRGKLESSLPEHGDAFIGQISFQALERRWATILRLRQQSDIQKVPEN
jgi:hypothetical protein